MGVKILFFYRGTLGQNSMFPERGGQNSIFFPSALKKGGQNRGAYQPTSLKGCPLVRVISFHSFKSEPRNSDKRCKTHWLRSRLFGGWLTLTFNVQFNLKVQIYCIFSLWCQNQILMPDLSTRVYTMTIFDWHLKGAAQCISTFNIALVRACYGITCYRMVIICIYNHD